MARTKISSDKPDLSSHLVFFVRIINNLHVFSGNFVHNFSSALFVYGIFIIRCCAAHIRLKLMLVYTEIENFTETENNSF